MTEPEQTIINSPSTGPLAALHRMTTPRRDFLLFLVAGAILGITQSIEGAAFNNFLNDTFHITVFQRTLIEIPRELPGFLVVFIMGTLMFMGDRRMAVVANLAAGAGMLMLGRFSPNLGIAVFWTFVFSSGQHLFMPLNNSIGMSFSDNSGIGRRLGLLGSVNTAAFLLASLVTFLISKRFGVSYEVLFTIGAVAFFAAALCLACMSRAKTTANTSATNTRATNTRATNTHATNASATNTRATNNKKKNTDNDESNNKPRRFVFRFVFRRQYLLYYLLSVVYGARKQIFVTFGPWVLIKVFNQDVGTFALLGFVIAGAGMLFKPLVGYCIDKRGERFVLLCDAVILALVCIGYSCAETVTNRLGLPVSVAMAVVCGCYVTDQLLTGTGIARATYLRKIAVSMEDVSPTLSMGTSMDHVVSMIIPFLGAFLWDASGYSLVFIGGAVIAVMNFIIALWMNRD